MDNILKHLKESWFKMSEEPKKKKLDTSKIINKISKILRDKKYPDIISLKWVGMDKNEIWGHPSDKTDAFGNPKQTIYDMLPSGRKDNSEEENQRYEKQKELFDKNIEKVLALVNELPPYKDWVPVGGDKEDQLKIMDDELKKRAIEFAKNIHSMKVKSMMRKAHNLELRSAARKESEKGPSEKLIKWAYDKLKADLHNG